MFLMLRTASQRKKICTNCPTAKTADLIGDSSLLLIIRDLLTGPKRFGELEESLVGISTRTITLKLRSMEDKDLVKKVAKDNATFYTLTPRGRGLSKIADAMRAYGEKYLTQ